MTSSINTFNFPKDMNLTIIKNSSKLSSYEQKNLAILILVRYKLAFFVKQNPNDEFINKLYEWLVLNIMDFRDIDIAFTTYNNTKDGTPLKNELFKIVKPLEELAFYLSKIAELNNKIMNEKINNDDSLLVKSFTLNLLSYWFNRLLNKEIKRQTFYFKEILDFDFEAELLKINKEYIININKDEPNKVEQINLMYDSSFEVADFLSTFVFRIASIPIRGARKIQGDTKKKKNRK